MDQITQGLALARLHGLNPEIKDSDIGPSYALRYLSDFNLIYSIEEKMGLHNRVNTSIRVKWVGHLHSIVARRCPLNKVGSPLVSDIDKMFANCEERAEALLKTAEVWEK